ncbi:hypothetical protein [Arsenicicoccus sp. oral taxon 190]|uniref:hypothetical protein n=1 Tax=Arsenicicoccus sp. oral taxon 190 TaxID=1658671 RepID=UPI0020A20BBA|nr:hypothetical protein [Arsenicicoccus sp. oral taxon 190]
MTVHPTTRAARLLSTLTGALLLGVAVAQVVAPVRVLRPHRGWLVVATVVVLLAAVTWLARRPTASAPVPGGSLPGGLVGAAVAGVTSWGLHYDTGWDAGTLRWMAQRLQAGEGLTPEQATYLAHYPNNLPVLAVLRTIEGVRAQVPIPPELPVAAVAAVAAGVSVALVGSLTCGRPGLLRSAATTRSVLAQVVCVLLVAASPWTTVLYSDLLVLPLPILGVWLMVRAARAPSRRAAWWWVAASVVVGVGAAVKATVLVTALAAPLLVRRGRLDLQRGRRWILPLVLCAVAAACAYAATTVTATRVATHDVALDRDLALPVERWIWLGLTPVHRGDGTLVPGGYTAAIDQQIGDRTTTQTRGLARGEIAARVRALGPGGLALWTLDKARWNLGDGTFYAYGEGWDRDAAPRAVAAAPAWSGPLRQLSTPGAPAAAVREGLTQGLWLATLAAAGISALRVGVDGAARRRGPGRGSSRSELSPEASRVAGAVAVAVAVPVAAAVAVVVLGAVAFTCVMETRSRYLFDFAPLVVVLAAGGSAARHTRGRRSGPQADPSGTVHGCPPPR